MTSFYKKEVKRENIDDRMIEAFKWLKKNYKDYELLGNRNDRGKNALSDDINNNPAFAGYGGNPFTPNN